MLQDLGSIELGNTKQHIKAAHVLGCWKILADQLSRIKIQPTEWMLHKSVVQKIFHLWGFPLIDLFASIRNKQTPIFCS